MRFAGAADAARGFGLHDHLCWSYEDADQLRLSMAEFLADGLRQDQQVCHIAVGGADDLLTELAELVDAEQAVSLGTLQLLDLEDMYDTSAPVDPQAQVAAYAAATSRALTAGHTGLRVAAEVTPLVRTSEQVEAFARYEHLADRYMANQPLTALCAYNRTELGADTVAQLACMHPTSTPGSAPFRLHAVTRHHLALSGELDLTAKDLLPRALRRVQTWPGQLLIDAADLAFVDHHGLLALDEFARDRGVSAVLVDPPTSGPARLAAILRLRDVRVECTR
jgi:ABC-type transporter Mla MlaB component